MEKQLSEDLTLYKRSLMRQEVQMQLRVSMSSDLGLVHSEIRRMGP